MNKIIFCLFSLVIYTSSADATKNCENGLRYLNKCFKNAVSNDLEKTTVCSGHGKLINGVCKCDYLHVGTECQSIFMFQRI